jgi:hypothetical protein
MGGFIRTLARSFNGKATGIRDWHRPWKEEMISLPF